MPCSYRLPPPDVRESQEYKRLAYMFRRLYSHHHDVELLLEEILRALPGGKQKKHFDLKYKALKLKGPPDVRPS